MRVLLTGERDWDDEFRIEQTIDLLLVEFQEREIEFLLGDCPTGLDAFARAYCEREGIRHVVFFADWAALGGRAGPERNGRMVRAGAVLGVAFWSGRRDRSGTLDCLSQGTRLGIPFRIVPRPRKVP